MDEVIQEIGWTVTEPNGEVKTTGKRAQLPHRKAFEITKETPDAQKPVMEGWNEMRQCLIDNGLMKQK